VERFGYRVHGFCCMMNHIHLAVQIAEDLCPGLGCDRWREGFSVS
jgi:hypothetical protein